MTGVCGGFGRASGVGLSDFVHQTSWLPELGEQPAGVKCSSLRAHACGGMRGSEHTVANMPRTVHIRGAFGSNMVVPPGIVEVPAYTRSPCTWCGLCPAAIGTAARPREVSRRSCTRSCSALYGRCGVAPFVVDDVEVPRARMPQEMASVFGKKAYPLWIGRLQKPLVVVVRGPARSGVRACWGKAVAHLSAVYPSWQLRFALIPSGSYPSDRDGSRPTDARPEEGHSTYLGEVQTVAALYASETSEASKRASGSREHGRRSFEPGSVGGFRAGSEGDGQYWLA